MKKLLGISLFVVLISSCSSSRLVDEYINTESPNFQATKVLVVGLTSDVGLQRQFEYSLVQTLEAEGVPAVKSVDYFESTVDENKEWEENLENIEKELLKAGFDAVLFSKVTGQESKVTVAQSYRNLSKSFESFSDYYYENKAVYGSGQVENYLYTIQKHHYIVFVLEKREI